MAKRWGPVKLGNEIQRVRSVFKFALESGLIDRPVLFGPTFKKPVAKVLRITKAAKGPTDFSAVQILAILKLASPSMKAMTLLGINGGMNNIDVATLTTKPINLDNRWLTYPRTKTGIGRKIPLWPETVAAIREALTVRRKPRSEDDAELLFISPQGKSYYRERHNKENGNETGARTDALSHEFAVLLESAKIEGHGFRDLRRTFQTIAEGCHDIVAVKAVTGHLADSRDMSEVYRQRIEDSRLIAAVNHVRAWLTTSD